MKKLCLYVIAVAITFGSFAQNVPLKTAEIIATNFLAHQKGKIQKNNSLIVKDIHTEIDKGNTLYHIVSYEEGGFVVVSGNYTMSPVLAYSTENQINTESLNPALKMWIESHYNDVSEMHSEKVIQKQWNNILENNIPIRKTGDKIGPLTTSTWNQDRYYNAYCPEDLDVTGEIGGSYDNHVPNGCVAVAMSQIMYYHRFPLAGVSSYSYVSPYGRLTANFAEAYYNYNAMADIATGYSDAMALLILHCGIAVEMNYSPTGSSSQTHKARTAMVGYFNYSTTSRFERKEAYNDSIWISKIVQSISNRLPIIYSASKENARAGHAWVCDGYDIVSDTSAYLHFNWGWGAKGGNGWFLSTTNNGYIVGEDAIFGLEPKVTLSDCVQDTLTATYGSFASNHPTKNYINNANCSWLISTPNATSISLNVSAFSTELDNDVVTIYAGNSTSDPIVYQISGDTIQKGTVINVDASEVFITLTSNDSVTSTGFVFNYTATLSNPNYCNTNIDPGTPNVLSASNGTLTNGSGNDNYANSNACYWRIEPKNASGVWVDVTKFALERGDELSIYAHDHKFIQGVKFTDRIARYTIDNPPTGMVSTNKEKIYIMFRSDNDLNDKGWTLKWGTDVSISEQVSGISSLSIYPNPANDF
ncbi:MAG: hypothetical protein GX330_04120, partial [Bacteroidales bacterium]|nr:hypothetical protein [Bacteroidales bacterium]